MGNPTNAQVQRWAEIKFGLLASGAHLTQRAKDRLFDAKQPIRTRSGISGGLDVTLGGLVDVNVAVNEAFTLGSDFRLDCIDGEFQVLRHGETLCHFEPHPTPAYYEHELEGTGEKMHRIGQMCSRDRFCYGMTGPTCYFWKSDRRCKYCSIGKNFSADAARKQQDHFSEVLALAVSDPRLPAHHVLLGGGTPPGDDMGAVLAAEYCRVVKDAHPGLSVYVMIAAPLKNEYIDLIHDAGADELGMNLEFWSDDAWQSFIPGKHKEIGKRRYLEALEYAYDLFGPVNTRSILIAGLEDLEHTYSGAIQLAGMGIMPIVSPFRPLDGTMLSDRRGASGQEYVELWSRIDAYLEPLGVPLGPSCEACQNNTLALPFGDRYRVY